MRAFILSLCFLGGVAFASQSSGGGGGGAHSALIGLTTGDDHTQYVKGAGRATAQTIYGGTAVNAALTLQGVTGHTSGGVIVNDFLQTGSNGLDGLLKIFSEQGGTDYAVTFAPHATMTQTTAYVMPANDGDNLQFMQTNGSGALAWAAPDYSTLALLAGRAGGQTLAGGTAHADALILSGSSGTTGSITLNAADNTGGVGIGGSPLGPAVGKYGLTVAGSSAAIGAVGSVNGYLVLRHTGATDDQEMLQIVSVNGAANFRVLTNAYGVAYTPLTMSLADGTLTSAPTFGNDVVADGTPKAMYVGASGKLGFTSSSRRFKQDIADLPAGRALKLRPVTFAYKSAPAVKQVGLIAEEVETVVPEVVGHDKDGQADSIDYAKLVPVLLAEIQAQEKRIAALESFTGNVRAQEVARECEGPGGVTCTTGFCPRR